MNSSSGRIPELDGIRGVAISMVLVWHYVIMPIDAPMRSPLAYFQATGRLAWTGVDLFFVLSGFLIGGILLDSRATPNYFRRFYLRRFFRIVPVYLLVLAATYAFKLAAHPEGWSTANIPWYSYPLFLQNFWMAQQNDFGFFAVTWSLAIEEQFYLTLPFIIQVINPKRLLIVLASGILLAPLLRIALFFAFPQRPPWAFLMMPCRADALLLGVLAAWAMRRERCKRWLVKNQTALWAAGGVLLVGAGMIQVRFRSPFEFRMVSIGYTWMALLYVVVIVLAVTQTKSLLARVLRASWLRWLGGIAYGVYLVHYQLFSALFRSSLPHFHKLADVRTAVICLVVTLTLCRLSWTSFEKPLIDFAHTYNL